MLKLITMRAALVSPDYFGGPDMLGGDSWAAWRAVLIAAMGEPLTDDERAIFVALTGREREPLEAVEEFWGVVGRRGGKSRSTAVLAAFLSGCVDHRATLAPGQVGLLPVMAASKEQAQELFNFVVGVFKTSRALRELIETITGDTITLRSRVEIVVRAASFRRSRGFTAIGAIGDEAAFWHSENSANPDKEILDAVRPALATTGAPLIVISSPYAQRGELYRAFRRDYGAEGDPKIMVVKAASRTMNPSLKQSVVDRAFERDPASARAEYQAEFRADVQGFVEPDAVQACVHGVGEIAYANGKRYVGFVDPSGGSRDSMTAAVAHKEGDAVVLDAVRERKPPFSPQAVTAEFAEFFKSYKLTKITGDAYAGEWPRERFRDAGLTYETSKKVRSDIYVEMLPLINSQRVQLLDNQRLASQLCGLERRTARSGKDSIDHAPGGHDDLINAAAGAIVLAAAERKAMIITPELLARASRPGPYTFRM